MGLCPPGWRHVHRHPAALHPGASGVHRGHSSQHRQQVSCWASLLGDSAGGWLGFRSVPSKGWCHDVRRVLLACSSVPPPLPAAVISGPASLSTPTTPPSIPLSKPDWFPNLLLHFFPSPNRFIKARFIEYTDETFTVQKKRACVPGGTVALVWMWDQWVLHACADASCLPMPGAFCTPLAHCSADVEHTGMGPTAPGS